MALAEAAREMIVWENAQVRDSLVRGMEQAVQGKVVDLGGFAQHADDEESAGA